MYIKTECVVLGRKNFGEADRLLTIYTRDFGKISALAKGIRRPTSRKSGHLEPGSWCKIFLAKGKNIDILTEVIVINAYGINNFTQAKAAKVYHFLEIVDQLTVQNQKNLEVFDLLVKFLDTCEQEENFNLTASVFKIKLLKILGFFSSYNLKDSKAKDLLTLLEQHDSESQTKIKTKISDQNYSNKSRQAYLKLTEFLDSIIESLTEKKLKTTKFLNGHI